MKNLIAPHEAHRRIHACLPSSATIERPLNACVGYALRQKLLADRPFPPFDRSMMDGYAIRAESIENSTTFRVADQLPAGQAPKKIGDGLNDCIEIMTGAVVPEDANCVVPYEATERIDPQTIRFLEPTAHKVGDCIHKYASDRAAGDCLISNGQIVGAREIAVAASCGYTKLTVSAKPEIALISTGDELVEIGDQPKPYQIRRSNDLMMEAALQAAGYPVALKSHLPDDLQTSTDHLKEIITQAEVLILTGGVSMGKKDYIPDVLSALGFECAFHGVLQKPGKPFGFWHKADQVVFTLPGNPLSTLTCLHHYVIPALDQTQQITSSRPAFQVHLSEPAKGRDDLTVFMPVKLSSNNQATPAPVNNSGDLARILISDGYIELAPSKEKTHPAGKSFDFHPWF